MGALKEAAAERGLQPVQGGKRTMAEVLAGNWERIAAVMPKHVSSERMFQMAVSAYNHDPKLAECDIATFLSCLMRCSALGLEPSSVDGLGRAYILPFYNGKAKKMEATFILGYKGMIDLARRSGEIESISARAVYEGDDFEYEFGLNEKLQHIPKAKTRTPDKLTHAYMVCKFKNGGHHVEVMTKAEIEAVRARSKAKDFGPWKTDYEAMSKKSVIRRGFPFLPVSVEIQSAATSDETTGGFMLEANEVITKAEILPEGEPSLPPLTSGDVTKSAQDSSDAPEPISAENGTAESLSARRAVCRSCGNVMENIAPDAEASDIKFGCCEAPDYVIEEA